MNEIISEEELHDIYFKRLNLNLDVNYYNVRWTNTNEVQQFVTYLDEEEEDVGYIVDAQKSRGLKYKNFREQECIFESKNDIDEFIKVFMEWYNNSPQYILGGYSPMEFRKINE